MSSFAFFLRNISADGFVRDENKGKKYKVNQFISFLINTGTKYSLKCDLARKIHKTKTQILPANRALSNLYLPL